MRKSMGMEPADAPGPDMCGAEECGLDKLPEERDRLEHLIDNDPFGRDRKNIGNTSATPSQKRTDLSLGFTSTGGAFTGTPLEPGYW